MATPKLDQFTQTTCKPDCTYNSKHTVQIWDTNYKQWVHNAQKATEMVPNPLTGMQHTSPHDNTKIRSVGSKNL